MENLHNSLIPLTNIFLIDWLTVTFQDLSPDMVKSILGLSSENWVTQQKFHNGYPCDTFFGNIHIWYGADDPAYYQDSYNDNGCLVTAAMKARDNMGVCLNLSGQGCRAFEQYSDVGWFNLFEVIQTHNGHVTRLDLAYDDHMGVIDIRRFAYDIKSRNYRSKSKWAEVLWSDDQLQDLEGLSVYVGKRSSDVLIRVYDKAAERGFKDQHWIRVELQLRRDRAGAALDQILAREGIGSVAAGVLRNYLTVCVPSNDTNKSRWPVAYYWERVVGQMETIRLWAAPGEPYNFHKTEVHLIEQYCQFLLTFRQIHGPASGTELLYAAARQHGNKPLKKKYQNVINEHFARIKKTPPPLLHFSNDTFNMLFDDDLDCPWNTTKK